MRVPSLALADDLTGAAEVGAAFLPLTTRICLASQLHSSRSQDQGGLRVIDTDSRYASEAAVVRRTLSVLEPVPAGTPIVKKVDSSLRGPIRIELEVIRDRLRLPVVFAPAAPALGRTVRDGVARIAGTPLPDTGTWDAEERTAPADVPAALAPLPVKVIGLDRVRGAAGSLSVALESAFAEGAVAACDAEAATDLDRIVTGVAMTGRDVAWVGSAGLAQALARAVAGREGPGVGESSTPGSERADLARDHSSAPLLYVVGSASPTARDQVNRLVIRGVQDVRLDVTAPSTVALDAVRPDRDTVIHAVGNRPRVRSPHVVMTLADIAARVDSRHTLVLTGGETARAVLNRLDIGDLIVRRSWGDGVVVSRTLDGRIVVTKPGAFGGADTLARIADTLQSQEVAEEA